MTTVPAGDLTDACYRELAEAALGAVERQVDAWLESDVVDIDTHRVGGMLELHMPGGSQLVLSLQPPLHEVWLAARGGGFHLRWNGQQWRCSRTGAELFALLSEHASAQTGQPLTFTDGA